MARLFVQEAKAAEFIKTDNEDSALNVATVDEAITGAKDIVAERVEFIESKKQEEPSGYFNENEEKLPF